jgi:hypothetical protein
LPGVADDLGGMANIESVSAIEKPFLVFLIPSPTSKSVVMQRRGFALKVRDRLQSAV